MSAPLLAVEALSKTFRSHRGRHHVGCAEVSLTVDAGEAVGLVGASGAGKSTVARLVAGLLEPDTGRIVFEGRDLASLRPRDRRVARRRLHLVFQDPYLSLAPGLRVVDLVAEPLAIHRTDDRAGRRRRCLAALEVVQLTPAERYAVRYPHELSGGERQRVALARAVVDRPRLIVADEPTGMLDASIRADLVALMAALRAEHGIAYLHITHDLALAGASCDRLVVMAAGRVVEEGPSHRVLGAPAHPATSALVTAVRALQPQP